MAVVAFGGFATDCWNTRHEAEQGKGRGVTTEADQGLPAARDAADGYTPRHGARRPAPGAPGRHSGAHRVVDAHAAPAPDDALDDVGRFELLVAELHAPLLSYLVRRTDRQTAVDVLGDVLVVLWRRRAEIPVEAALPWAYGVARRCLANARRGAQRRSALAARLVVLDPPHPVDGPEAADVVDDTALRDAMARLTPPEAEALTLWAWEGLAPDEIAVALGVTPNAVSIRLHRAKIHLREALELHDRKDHDGTPDGTGSGDGPAMTSTTTDPAAEPDRDLRERLRLADPLSTRTGRLDPRSLELLVSELTRTPVEAVAPATTRKRSGSRTAGRSRRRFVPAVAGVAAAAALVVAALVLPGMLGSDPPAPEDVPSELALTLPVADPSAAACLRLSPAVLAPATVALDGVVTEADVGIATLRPTRWYAGGGKATVVVTTPPQVDIARVGAPLFEVGKRYLLAGGNGQLTLCGASAAWSPELEAVYGAAFPS